MNSTLELNSKEFWDWRFRENWGTYGRLQTNLFAVGFILLDENFNIGSILDYGCGCGDSLPILKMKYPKCDMFYYDISDVAMNKASEHYGNIGKPFDINKGQKVDLVYCSNVIEHVPDAVDFCKKLASLSKNYVVIQAPYEERHDFGIPITKDQPIFEHIRTITKDMLDDVSDLINWTLALKEIPYAWNRGMQIFFIGKIRGDIK